MIFSPVANFENHTLGGATSQKSQKEIYNPLYLLYYCFSGDALGVKINSMINLILPYKFGLLVSSQNWKKLLKYCKKQ